jgi:hypothetical protein
MVGGYMVSIWCPEMAEKRVKERLKGNGISIRKERGCRFGAEFPATPFFDLGNLCSVHLSYRPMSISDSHLFRCCE